MSGFSADWLALRELADHRARDASMKNAVAAAFAGRDHISIVDLACGAGSNARALAPWLSGRQTWRLVDHDPALLGAARERLVAWTERVESDAPLLLHKEGREIEIVFDERDLAAFDAGILEEGADLVTAAALFDLVSTDWIERFCDALAARRLPLLAVLTYSGEENWTPPHPADAAMLAAFHAHQASDKGFGPAAGPSAIPLLKSALKARGYIVVTAPSPWRLDRSDAALIEALADGAAQAVAETGLVEASAVEDWRRSRRAAAACEIGHIDLFAVPVSPAG